MREFRMPSMGSDMDAGTLLEWRVEPGQAVHKGDIVAVVDTDKSAIDVEVFHDGVVHELLVEPGTTVPVGTPLALLREAEESVPTTSRPEEDAPTSMSAPTAATAQRVHSPLLRQLATERGVDIDQLHGSGPGGRIRREDLHPVGPQHRPERRDGTDRRGHRDLPDGRRRVTPRARRLARQLKVDLAAVAPRKGTVVTGEDVRVTGPSHERGDKDAAMRRAIAANMARSAREIPHYRLATTVDMKAAMAWLEAHNAERPISQRVLPAAMLLAAAARAAADTAEMNGFYTDEAFHPAESVHLGVAIALRGGGLIAPAIHDADTLTVDELMDKLRDLIKRTRKGGLRGSEMTDPTLTVTSLGDQGVEEVHGIIYPPQVALVGFGTLTDRPVALDDRVEVHPTVRLTLAADHRVSDGLHGGRFLRAIQHILEHPEEQFR